MNAGDRGPIVETDLDPDRATAQVALAQLATEARCLLGEDLLEPGDIGDVVVEGRLDRTRLELPSRELSAFV